jgi:hypothetical protein
MKIIVSKKYLNRIVFHDNASGWEDALTLRNPYCKQAPKEKGNCW